jgi:competence protein ComFC
MLPAPLTHCFEAGLALLYPRICQLCEKERATPEQGFVCAKCWTGVRFIKAPYCECCGLPYEGQITGAFQCSNCLDLELHFSSARSAVTAKGVTLEVIHRFKYQRALWFEPFLADLLLRVPLCRCCAQSRGTWSCRCHCTRLKSASASSIRPNGLPPTWRGPWNVPLRSDLVRRVLPTRTQTLLTKTQRADNVCRAFAPGPGGKLHGARIVLVDDVLTTGATTSACARVCGRQARAKFASGQSRADFE